MIKHITFDEGVAIMVEREYRAEDFVPLWERWLLRGDTVLVFQNQDLDHPDLGHVLSTPHHVGDPMPKQGPDTPMTGFGWRYTVEWEIATDDRK